MQVFRECAGTEARRAPDAGAEIYTVGLSFPDPQVRRCRSTPIAADLRPRAGRAAEDLRSGADRLPGVRRSRRSSSRSPRPASSSRARAGTSPISAATRRPASRRGRRRQGRRQGRRRGRAPARTDGEAAAERRRRSEDRRRRQEPAPPPARRRPHRRRRPRRRPPRRAGGTSARPTGEPRVKKYLIAGLLVWLPLAVTIWVLQAVLGLLDGVFVWLLAGSQVVLPEGATRSSSMLRKIPGLGVIVMLVGLLLTGVFATNIVGQWCAAPGAPAAQPDPDRQVDLQLGEAGLGHAVLEQRQRLSRGGAGAVPARRLPGRSPSSPASRAARRRMHLRGDYLSVYVPTTPNPTSGFFLMVPRSDVDRAGDERRRGAEVRDLDGRRRAADAHRPGRRRCRCEIRPG